MGVSLMGTPFLDGDVFTSFVGCRSVGEGVCGSFHCKKITGTPIIGIPVIAVLILFLFGYFWASDDFIHIACVFFF